MCPINGCTFNDTKAHNRVTNCSGEKKQFILTCTTLLCIGISLHGLFPALHLDSYLPQNTTGRSLSGEFVLELKMQRET